MSTLISLAVDRLQRAARDRNNIPDWFHHEHVTSFLNEVAARISDVQAERLFALCYPVTGMPGAAYGEFMREGVYKTLWQTGPTWHGQYISLDKVEWGRDFNEKRLFAERIEEGAYAIVMPGQQYSLPYQLPAGLRTYMRSHGEADHFVRWRASVFEDATFTYGDSQQNMMALPFSPKFMAAYAICWKSFHDARRALAPHEAVADALRHRMEERMPSLCLFFFGPNNIQYNPYFELQIHRRLTPDDVHSMEVSTL